MIRPLRWCAVLAVASAGLAQTGALLPARDTLALCRHVVDLMDAATVAPPGLARAAAPTLESTRQSLAALEAQPQNAALTYAFAANARAFLALSDSLPKPYPFPAEAGRQLSELRDSLDRLDQHFRALLERDAQPVRRSDSANLNRYAAANDKLGPPIAARPRVVFLGDSITDFWRLNEYFPDRDYVNRGIGGQVTSQMLLRMQTDVIELKPAVLVVLGGTNDIAGRAPLPAVEANLSLIADLAEFHHIRPVFASLLPISDYHGSVDPLYFRTRVRSPAEILGLNQWIRGMCERRHFVYLDYFSSLVDQAGFLQADLADDGLHPNPRGYRVMAPLARAAIERALRESAGSRPRR